MTRTALSRNGTRQAQSPGELHGDEEGEVGEQQADWEAGLDEAGELAALEPRGVLVRHEDGAAPLRAVRQTLDDADRDEEGGSEGTYLRVCREGANEHRGQTHDDQGDDEDRLATDPVTQVAADDAAERSGDEAHTKCGERGEGAHERVLAREEDRAEVEGCGGAESDEVVGLDDRARGRAEGDPGLVSGAVNGSSHLQGGRR